MDSSDSELSWVIDSKFTPYHPGLDLVRRERLLKKLVDSDGKKLVLINAPAGYGKSSLLGQWTVEAKNENIHHGWLTLEVEDAEPKQFLAYITLALSRIGVDLDELLIGARNRYFDSAIEVILHKLVRQLNLFNQRLVLILEDYHQAESDAVNEIIVHLMRNVLSDFTIFIDSRTSPNLGVFSMIAAGDAIEIDAPQLRLTRDETLNALIDVTDDATSNEIYEQTEGWPVAVQLARLQKRNRPSEPVTISAKGGLIASYLTEQVLNTLDDATQDFLLSVAFLNRFNADLVNAVMKSPNAWGRIDGLASFSAFIVPLDVEQGWYRLHHLFAEYLKEHQIRKNPSYANEILRLASHWYMQRDDIVRAVSYAARANDFELCRTLIRDAGGWRIILTSGIGELRGALRILPQAELRDHPSLLIATAYLHCKDGEFQLARAQLNAAIDLIDGDVTQDIMIERVVVDSMINLYEDNQDWDEGYRRTREDLVTSGALDPLERGTLKCEETCNDIAACNFSGAAENLREAFANMRQSGSVLGLNYCYLHAAHIALHRADFQVAVANIDRALSMAEENFGSDSGLKNLALVLHYVLAAWQGRGTHEDLEQFEAALEHIFAYDGWTGIYMTGLEGFVLASVQCRRQKNALALLHRLSLLADEKGLDRLGRYIEVLVEGLDPRPPQKHGGKSRSLSLIDAPRDWEIIVDSPDLKFRYDEIGDEIMDILLKGDANLKAFKLEFAQVAKSLQNNDTAALLGLVKKAAKQEIIGPFLASAEFLKALDGLRGQLRHDEQELVTLQFVDELLRRGRALSPKRQDGFLNDREAEIIQKLALGQSNKEIARALELTENTVKFHLKSLYSKLSVNKRTQAVIEAQKLGLLD